MILSTPIDGGLRFELSADEVAVILAACQAESESLGGISFYSVLRRFKAVIMPFEVKTEAKAVVEFWDSPERKPQGGSHPFHLVFRGNPPKWDWVPI